MKIAVLASGGVDSSLALALLKEQGHDITAFYLKIWLEDELSSLGECPWEHDLSYVKKTCDMLDVPLKVMPLQKEYHRIVVSHSIAAIKEGLTPNPDVWCNEFIKFGAFFDCIGDEYEKIATGHYAQLLSKNNTILLKQAPDPVKDQTYFLCNLSKKQLSRALFPIGHLAKKEVRDLAQKYNLPASMRKDSQGICFLGKFKFREFVAHHLGKRPGNFVNYDTQEVIGSHDGHWFYTIGQRRDIRLSGGPWYVVGKNPSENSVFISNNYDAIQKPRSTFNVKNIRWLSEPITMERDLLVKVRHRAQPRPCTIAPDKNNGATVKLHTKDQGIAPGQFAVFYDGDICIGSGLITQ